jgi:ABC-type antimicrobial peptide transport system permease subunit
VAWLGTLARPVRWAAVGAASLGVVGAVVGLIVGFYVHAPTAPFAMVELGLPATIAGGCVALIIGTILAAGRRISRNHP